MYQTTGHYKTVHGSKYLQQLCKHFAHKIEVTYDKNTGVCQFVLGAAYLNADTDGLSVRFELKEQKDIQQAQNVIDSHLQRFAHREDFTNMVWQG